MLDRKWKYPLEYAEELYFKAKRECMDSFIYEARSLYTLLVTKYQSYSFGISEVEDHIRALEHKINLTWGYLAFPYEEYMKLIEQIETEIDEIKSGLENNINKEEQHD